MEQLERTEKNERVERKYLKEDIKQCFHCKQFIETPSYILLNKKLYFHRSCLDEILYKPIELLF